MDVLPTHDTENMGLFVDGKEGKELFKHLFVKCLDGQQCACQPCGAFSVTIAGLDASYCHPGRTRTSPARCTVLSACSRKFLSGRHKRVLEGITPVADSLAQGANLNGIPKRGASAVHSYKAQLTRTKTCHIAGHL